MVSWVLAACDGEKDWSSHELPEPVSDTGEESATGDTGIPMDTGTCVPVPEIVMNDADDDCDGWADEYGQDWPRIAVAGGVVMRDAEVGLLGMDMKAAIGSDDRFWIAASTTAAYELQGKIIAANLLGDVLELRPDDDASFLDYPAVLRLEGTDASVAVGHRLYSGSGLQTLSNAAVTGQRLGVPDAYNLGAQGADIDGDGFDELINFQGNLGRFFIQDGPVTSPTWDNVRAEVTGANLFLVGEAADLDGDGVREIPAFSQDGAGETHLVPGNSTGALILEDISIATLRGEDAGDDAGWGAVSGDANGDGYQDLALGSPLADGRWGKAYLVLGPITGDRMLADADAQVIADWADDYCGVAQDFVPDEDGDGADELAVACPRSLFGSYVRAPGRIQFYRGSDAAGTLGIADAATVWVGEGPYDLAGNRFQTRDDADGDGWADLVVAVPADTSLDGATHGTVYLVRGPLLP